MDAKFNVFTMRRIGGWASLVGESDISLNGVRVNTLSPSKSAKK